MDRDRGDRLGRYGVSAFAACLAVGALVEDLVNPRVTLGNRSYERAPEAILVVVMVGVAALIALRGRIGVAAPIAAVGLLGLASLSAPAWVLESTSVYLVVMFSCGLAGFMAESRRGYAGLLVLWATGTVAVLQHPTGDVGKWVSVLALMTIAWTIGVLVRGPVVRARSAEERAAQLEQEQQDAARQAVIDERQRIARELHDIIAHSVSVMTVQAGAVRRRLTTDQERERDSLVAVERTGREALAEMRRLVGLLREEDAEPSYGPQPGMQALDRLIANVRAAGLAVDLEVEGTSRELPPGVDLAAYRVVQEALTNALKHAGPGRAWVRICWRERELQIDVANDGRHNGEGIGFGHAGMRERLRLYGGRLESGARAEGGYLVRAYVPIGADA
ncbi:MAG: sensor histidine kinase [Actinomycetes bacterium]